MARPRKSTSALVDPKRYPPLLVEVVHPDKWKPFHLNPRSVGELNPSEIGGKILREGWSPKLEAGVPVRPRLFKAKDGSYVVLRGHRRLAGLQWLKEKHPKEYEGIVGKGIEVDVYQKPLSDIEVLAAMNDNVDMGLQSWSQPARFDYWRNLILNGYNKTQASKELGMAVNPITGQAKHPVFEALSSLPTEVQDYWMNSQRKVDGYRNLPAALVTDLAKQVRAYRDGPGKGAADYGPEFAETWEKFKAGEIVSNLPAVMKKDAAENAAAAFARAEEHEFAELVWLLRGYTYDPDRTSPAMAEPDGVKLAARLNEFVDEICGEAATVNDDTADNDDTPPEDDNDTPTG